jgi:hypothetical protein
MSENTPHLRGGTKQLRLIEAQGYEVIILHSIDSWKMSLPFQSYETRCFSFHKACRNLTLVLETLYTSPP